MQTSLASSDLRRIVLHLPKDLRKQLTTARLFLAGGCIRSIITNEQPSDFDVFGEGKEYLEVCAKEICGQRSGKLHTTDNAFTVLTAGKIPVQYIHRWCYSDPVILLNEFDFTIAKAVVWFDNEKWHSLCDSSFYSDLAAKRLVYCAPQRTEDAGGSLLRVRKFLSRGYYISAFDLGCVVARLVRGVAFDKLRDNDEKHLGNVIVGLLREVDPLLVVDGIDAVDEHASVNGIEEEETP